MVGGVTFFAGGSLVGEVAGLLSSLTLRVGVGCCGVLEELQMRRCGVSVHPERRNYELF